MLLSPASCDGIRHCQSGEDEVNCTMIDIPEYYDKMDPPEKVFANISIVDVMAIDEDDSSFDVYFHLSVKWYDRKLEFQFLKNNHFANNVEKYKNRIWSPKIRFAFLQKSFDDFEEKMFVEKSRPKPVDLQLLNAAETYNGIDTPLFHFSEHSKRFLCEFNGISQYPFIKDTCSFYLYLDGSGNKLTTVKSSIEAPANKMIGQYTLSDWEIKSNVTYPRSMKKMVKISVSLTKDPFNIIMVTYLPSLLMNIINQAINYIPGDSAYDLIITVNITSMVVLATIYMSVSTSLPSTANIKPIEVWLLFNLAYPILVILANIVMKVNQTKTKKLCKIYTILDL